MNTYIAFIRGINVGGKNKIKMVDLRQSLAKIGLHHVQTYIQSGNVIFDSSITEFNTLEQSISKAIYDDFSFDVLVIVKTENAIRLILNNNPFSSITNQSGLYFALLQKTPSIELIQDFKQLHFKNEDFRYTDTCVYINCKRGAGKAKLNNNLIEKKLNVPTTTRNLNTMLKVIDLADS